MIACSPEKAIKNIFERSLKSLNDSRDQLYKTRKILKKAVYRLSATSSSSNTQLNGILDEIISSADKKINLEVLDSQLDQLSILTIKNETSDDISIDTEFYSSLKSSLDGLSCSDTCRSIVNTLINSKPSDKEISIEIIKLINDSTINKA